MLKKLVALTLAALMLINPMTAMAVSWNTIKADLLAKKSFERTENIEASVDEDGKVTIIGYGGTIEDFEHSAEFKSYSFQGEITIGGETFEVYVYDVPVLDEDGNTKMQPQQVVVNVESGVAITAQQVKFNVSDNSTLEVTTKGNIGFNADGMLVTERVEFEVSNESTENAKLTVNNEGSINVSGEIWMSAEGKGTLEVTNDGTMTSEKEIGLHAYDDATAKLTNNDKMTSNNNGQNEEGSQLGIGVHGNGDVTVNNSEGATIYGEVSGWIDTDSTGGSLSITNDGIVAGNLGAWGFDGYTNDEGEWIETNASGSIVLKNEGTVEGSLGTTTNDAISTNLENSGTVEGDMFAENNGTQDMTVKNVEIEGVEGSGVVQGDLSVGNNGSATTTVDNYGAVNGNMEVYGTSGTIEATNYGSANMLYAGVEGNATVKTTNDGSGTVNVQHSDVDSGTLYQTNNGKVTEQFSSEVNDGNVYNTNNGIIEGFMSTNVKGEGSAEVTNNDTVYGDLSANANGIYDDDGNLIANNGGSTVNLTNNGTAENLYSGAVGAGSITVTNNNTVNNELVVDTINGTVNVVNNSTVGGQLDGWANGENGSVTVINTGSATVGSGEDGNGIWVSAENGAKVEGINAGMVNGELGGGAYAGGDTTVVNLNKADSSWVESYDGGNLMLDNSGTIAETPVAAGNSKITMVITTEGSEVTDTATVQELYKQSVVNWEDRTGDTEIITTTQDGQPIARYSVAADGTVVLEEVLMEQDGGDGDDPRFWTKERIRHDMEEKRKAAEIGGVYGSPYWLKQLYIGYMSLNLRLFNGEKQLLFKENISWVPGTGAAGEKVLTLNVKLEDTANLTMRLDGAVIGKLEQAGIVTINIVDGVGNLFMTYQVEDLKGAREMYGLTQKEYIVVGSADADVMKIAEDGTISPIEGETKPVEEVAEEAKAETEEEAAEGTRLRKAE